MATVAKSEILKWARELNPKSRLLGGHAARSACRNLAANKTAEAVPFLVSALANRNQQVRRIAAEGLKSLESQDAIDALVLGYALTKQEPLREILAQLGRDVTESPQAAPPEPRSQSGAGEPPWRFWRLCNSRDQTVLAFIPEGDFLAGKEGFCVHLPAYYLALSCVTAGQYARFLNETQPNAAKLSAWINLAQGGIIAKDNDSYNVDPKKTELPVVWVAWEGAAAYCKWAGLRLPTELEWEKGARGVDGRIYPWGDEWDTGRPLCTDAEPELEAVTGVWAHPMACSPYGLYQMIGNVYEWCADWYEQDAYQRYARDDLRSPRQADNRVLRGGPWRFGTPAYLRTEYRKGTVWRAGTPLCGFRCAKSL